MAKINIHFNNKEYSVDESSLASAASELKSHLSTTMSGTGATINLGGTTYNIDSTKLTNATNAFVSHLGTIAGNGSKVVIGGVEYGIDSAKTSGAVAQIHTVLGSMASGGNEPEAPVQDTFEFNVILYTFDGDITKTYRAVKDMTWAEWLDSEYNIDGFHFDEEENMICVDENYHFINQYAALNEGDYIDPSFEYIDGTTYPDYIIDARYYYVVVWE